MKWFLIVTVLFYAAGIITALAPVAGPLPLTIALCGVWAFGWHMAWQLRRLDTDDPALCLKIFQSNRDAGLIPVLFFAIAFFL